MSKSSGEALSVSYTVATLDARTEFARLRRLLAPFIGEDSANVEARGECERLVDVLTDAYHAQDGMVDDESYCAKVESLTEQLDDMQDDLEKETAKREEAEARLRQLLEAAEETPDAVQSRLTEAIARQAEHNAEIARYKAVAEREKATATQYAKEASKANAALNAANYRMASWSTDKKAVETADHYRIKYEEAMARETKARDALKYALQAAYADAARSKVKRETLRSLEASIETLLHR